jgi:hypothetical protein
LRNQGLFQTLEKFQALQSQFFFQVFTLKKSWFAETEFFLRFERDLDFQKSGCRLTGRLFASRMALQMITQMTKLSFCLNSSFKYRTRTIITHLDYNQRILDPKIEEFPCLAHKLSVKLTSLQYKPQ